MGKREILQALPNAALKELGKWFDMQERLPDTRGWLKIDYVEFFASKLTVPMVEQLNQGAGRDKDFYFSDALLVEVLGLPSKEMMLALMDHADLRSIMEELDEAGRVAGPWRSLPAYALREYMMRKFSAPEIGELTFDLVRNPSPGTKPKTKKPPVQLHSEESTQDDPVAATSDSHRATAVAPRCSTFDELFVYLEDGLRLELECCEYLGKTEMTFHGEIYRLIYNKLGEPFRLENNYTVPGTSLRTDVLIKHARRHIAIEIKPNGQADGLLADVEKLGGYIKRNKTSQITHGFLIFKSVRATPNGVLEAAHRLGVSVIRVAR